MILDRSAEGCVGSGNLCITRMFPSISASTLCDILAITFMDLARPGADHPFEPERGQASLQDAELAFCFMERVGKKGEILQAANRAAETFDLRLQFNL